MNNDWGSSFTLSHTVTERALSNALSKDGLDMHAYFDTLFD